MPSKGLGKMAMAYQAPTADLLFLLDHVVGFETVLQHSETLDRDTVAAVLGEAASLSETKIAPLQRPGDLHPAKLENGVVITSPGYRDGYQALAEGGWIGMSAPEEYGGMGLPRTLSTAVHDMLSSACLSLQLNPVLTQGQIHALDAHGSDAIKDLYLPKLISGEWAGVMDLTEPQAGSDVGALRTKAEAAGDGVKN